MNILILWSGDDEERDLWIDVGDHEDPAKALRAFVEAASASEIGKRNPGRTFMCGPDKFFEGGIIAPEKRESMTGFHIWSSICGHKEGVVVVKELPNPQKGTWDRYGIRKFYPMLDFLPAEEGTP